MQKYHFIHYERIAKEDIDVKSSNEVTILQYNVFWRPWLLHIGREEYVGERSKILADSVDSFDICCLNESFHFGSTYVKEFVETVKSHGFDYVVTSQPVKLFSKFVIDSGLMIFSKYPIVATDSITYKDGIGWDAMSAKGVLYAKIKLGDSKFLHVFSTHLQASYNDVTSNDVNIRQYQIKELVAFMKTKCNDGFPLALLADFNVNSCSNNGEYQKLVDLLEIDEYVRIDTAFDTYGYHPITFADNGENQEKVLTEPDDLAVGPQCLDYIFLFKGKKGGFSKYTAKVHQFSVKGHEYIQLSDHLGLQCSITQDN